MANEFKGIFAFSYAIIAKILFRGRITAEKAKMCRMRISNENKSPHILMNFLLLNHTIIFEKFYLCYVTKIKGKIPIPIG